MDRRHEREMSSGRMSDHNHTCGIDGILLCKRSQAPIRRLDIAKRFGPTAAGVAHTAVFDIEGRNPSAGEGGAHVADVPEIVFCAPETTMDDDGKRKCRSLDSPSPALGGLGLARDDLGCGGFDGGVPTGTSWNP
jgi:hypothetical protein